MRAITLIITLVSMTVHRSIAAKREYPIRPVPFTQVTLSEGFWEPRLKTNRDVTVWYDFRKCEETGRIDNFAVAGGLKPGGFRGIFFNDSDVFKVIEGAAYCLASSPDPKLDEYLDDLIAKIAAAQEEDGYLYTARTINDPQYDFPGRSARWSHVASGHELYNVGHLYEAAVAHWQATGKRALLDVALKNADLVCQVFGPGEGQRIDVPGHEEIEIGLVKLYRATGNEKYLRQAEFFIDMRGRSDKRKTYGPYCQDHQPVVEQQEAVGHAVRAGYLYAGVADVAAIAGRSDYLRAIDRIWNDIVSKKLYLTGGVGATGHGEAFGVNYQLPNDTAYNETCAAIAQALFQHRMFLLHGDSKYIDVLERILYNGFLSGVSLSGDRFFYPNPLAANGRTPFNQGVLGRSPWFDCSCCPVNVVRFIPSIAGFVYATRDRSAYVNLYAQGTGRLEFADTTVTLRQQTDYPWDGGVRIHVDLPQPTEFALHLRVPGWVQGHAFPSDLYRYVDDSGGDFAIRINGQQVRQSAGVDKGYVVLRRTWNSGETIECHWPMPVRTVVAHRDVVADRGRVALERGPIVYCFEAIDNEGSVFDLVLPESAQWKAEHRADLLGGVTVLTGKAQRVRRQADGSIARAAADVTAVPYYAWAHRQMGEMAVWMARDPEAARPQPAPTLASASRVSVSHVWQLDTPQAVNDQIEPTSSSDQSIPRHTWWDHRGTHEWVQYDFPQPATVSRVHVYWFDDTGRGHCRVPKSWRILALIGGEWTPVQHLAPYTTEKDQYNVVRCEPVETAAVRLDVQLEENFSAGVLEWRVE